MNKDVSKIVNRLFELAGLTDECDEGNEINGEKKVHQMARHEIINFLMYLSASSGSIEMKEALFIKDYFKEQISPEEICQRIEDDNLYSSSFEQKVPLVLKRLVKYDNKIFDETGKLDISIAEEYICQYEALGKEFIVCDQEVSQSEKDDLCTYISNMHSFYNANYKGPKFAMEKSHTEHEVKNVESMRNRINNDQANEQKSDEVSLEELIKQMNSLIGLERVKNAVNQLVHFNTIKYMRAERGLDKIPMTMNMVFYGNPGTGKTTVARLIAKIYHKLGILSKGHLVEVDRSGLVAGYVGHTALKVNEVVKSAKGGVLFIDEAYSLTYKRSENDFGWEAVDTLIKAMEDYRDDLVIIVAGYPKQMGQFIEANPGLKSRFNRFINFHDYNGNELFQIYQKMVHDVGFIATPKTLEYSEEFFEEAYETKGENFANARLVRNYLESSIMNQADRLYSMYRGKIEDVALCTIEYDDVKDIV